MLAMLALEGARALRERGHPVPPSLPALLQTPAQRVPLREGLDPWKRLALVTDDPAVGLSLSDGTGVTAFHLLGSAFASAPHLLAAVQTLGTYFPYLCPAAHVFEHSLHGETVLGWEASAAGPPRALRDYVFAELLRALRLYPWQPVAPLRVELDGMDTRQAPVYRRAFGCRIQPARSISRIVLETASLVTPLRGANPSLHQHACQRLAADDSTPETASAQALGAIEQLMDEGETRIGPVASRLGISVRALQTRLAADGYRYSELLRRARQRRAVRWLCESDTPISAIAHALGYGHPVSFQRAFRQWFGASPGAFRQRHCGR